MSVVEFESLEAVCRLQQVSLNGDFLKLVREGPADPNCFAPTPMLKAIVDAATLLRQADLAGSQVALADKPVELPESWQEDTAAAALIDILNASLEPVEPDDTTISWATDAHKIRETCEYAEPAFALAALTATADQPNHVETTDIHIAVRPDDRPVFMKKGTFSGNFGMPSSLTFERVVISGVPYPPGSILSTPRKFQNDEPVARFPDSRGYGMHPGLRVVPVSEFRAATFLRLSALAFPPGERRAIFGTTPPYFKDVSDHKLEQGVLIERSIGEIAGAIGSVIRPKLVPAA